MFVEVRMADEYWTDEQVAEFVGTMQVDSVSGWARRHGVTRKMMMPADEVRDAAARMPGKGARTDLNPNARGRGARA